MGWISIWRKRKELARRLRAHVAQGAGEDRGGGAQVSNAAAGGFASGLLTKGARLKLAS